MSHKDSNAPFGEKRLYIDSTIVLFAFTFLRLTRCCRRGTIRRPTRVWRASTFLPLSSPLLLPSVLLPRVIAYRTYTFFFCFLGLGTDNECSCTSGAFPQKVYISRLKSISKQKKEINATMDGCITYNWTFWKENLRSCAPPCFSSFQFQILTLIFSPFIVLLFRAPAISSSSSAAIKRNLAYLRNDVLVQNGMESQDRVQ